MAYEVVTARNRELGVITRNICSIRRLHLILHVVSIEIVIGCHTCNRRNVMLHRE